MSELARPEPEPAVLSWAYTVPVGVLCTTVITEAELRFGAGLLPAGRRQRLLAEAVEAVLSRVVQDRVLPYDRPAAREFAAFAIELRRQGRGVGIADLQIQAIARVQRVTAIVTRNAGHFDLCGIPLIDPWQPR